MAHVTYFRFKAKPGERQAVVDKFQNWTSGRRPKVNGFMRAVLTSSLEDPEEFIAAVMFDTTENYNANSNNPEQGAWYEELRSHLAADPDWFDGKLEMIADA
jgi:quinol monooxygenase YgiN